MPTVALSESITNARSKTTRYISRTEVIFNQIDTPHLISTIWFPPRYTYKCNMCEFTDILFFYSTYTYIRPRQTRWYKHFVLLYTELNSIPTKNYYVTFCISSIRLPNQLFSNFISALMRHAPTSQNQSKTNGFDFRQINLIRFPAIIQSSH